MKVYTILKHIENFLLMLLLIVMGLSLGMQVFFRYFLNTPLMWSEELARYLQITITFLGIGFGIRNNSHIAMVIVQDRLPKRTQKIIRVLVNLFLIACFVIFFRGAMDFVANQHQIRSSAMQIPMSYTYICIPVSCIIFIVWTIRSLIKDLFNIELN